MKNDKAVWNMTTHIHIGISKYAGIIEPHSYEKNIEKMKIMQFISEKILSEISYKSTLGQSLKQIFLRKTPLDDILKDIKKYRSEYTDIVVQENLIGSRFKSDDSVIRKYEKTLRMGGGFKQCFNDVLGFRLHFDKYPEKYPEYKYCDAEVGKELYKKYSSGIICTEEDFRDEMNRLIRSKGLRGIE